MKYQCYHIWVDPNEVIIQHYEDLTKDSRGATWWDIYVYTRSKVRSESHSRNWLMVF